MPLEMQVSQGQAPGGITGMRHLNNSFHRASCHQKLAESKVEHIIQCWFSSTNKNVSFELRIFSRPWRISTFCWKLHFPFKIILKENSLPSQTLYIFKQEITFFKILNFFLVVLHYNMSLATCGMLLYDLDHNCKQMTTLFVKR